MVLEKANVVTSVSIDRQTRLFPAPTPLTERRSIALLLRGRILEMMKQIAQNPGIVQKDLGDSLNMSRKVIRRYADLLAKQGLLEEKVDGHTRRYFATPMLIDALPRASYDRAENEKAQRDSGVRGEDGSR